MRFISISILLLIITSCSPQTKQEDQQETVEASNRQLKHVLYSAGLKGAILVFDPQRNISYSNDFNWAKKGQLPASTFKIPNSIIALETGVVANDSVLFLWDGQPRTLKNWEQDLMLKDAFKFSCVPCYQEIARGIGVDQMNDFISKLDYGHVEVTAENLDSFWLRGDSRISPQEQINFLKRFQEDLLPISSRTKVTVKQMMLVKQEERYQVYGKTGWSTQNEINNGWFVGFVESENKAYYFATNVEPKEGYFIQNFAKARMTVTFKALELLGIIP